MASLASVVIGCCASRWSPVARIMEGTNRRETLPRLAASSPAPYFLRLGLASFLFWAAAPSSSPSPPTTPLVAKSTPRGRKLVVGVDGGTESIRACCFDALNGTVVGSPCAVPYETSHPRPGWAEQDPDDWYRNLGLAVRGALDSTYDSDGGDGDGGRDDARERVCAICVDTTCCSVVALDERGEHLRPSLLWMDARSAPQTLDIMEKCNGDPALKINCGGEGPLSAEWMIPKALWLKQNEPEVWERASTICEYQDYVNQKLTGLVCASSCNAAARWHWDGEECLKDGADGGEGDADEKYPGRPLSLYRALGMPELAEKLPRLCLPMGSLVGGLTAEAAVHLTLREGLPVVQGGPDAFVGMVGLGCIHSGQLCLITGSSHLHCVVTSHPTNAPGTWGAYRGAPLPGLNFAEGGQSSTGSILRWAKGVFGAADVDYAALDDEASALPPGCEGLVALETYQGSRTPVTDPLARGAFVGLTLSHSRAHLWRALMEAVCYGTRACVEGLESAGHGCDEIVIAGGSTRSQLWLQMHADVTGKPVVVCKNADAPLLGCAILAAVGAGVHGSVEDAVKAMVRTEKRIVPETEANKKYNRLYENVYSKVSPAVRPVIRAISELRGGGHWWDAIHLQCSSPEATRVRRSFCGIAGSDGRGVPRCSRLITSSHRLDIRGGGDAEETTSKSSNGHPIISPSLLASDWSRIHSEIHRCKSAGATQLHVDVFDGVFLDSPNAFTFGPQMVKAMRQCCDEDNGTGSIELDVHMCVERPSRFVTPMAESGADRFIFQWEAIAETKRGSKHVEEMRLEKALELVHSIHDAGMKCGVSINPSTDVEDIYPLLESGLVDLVDILAVEPGFGGQTFQRSTLSKLRKLRDWRDEECPAFFGDKTLGLKLMIDGGINIQTAASVIEAGADVLVAGTFLFEHPEGIEEGISELLQGCG